MPTKRELRKALGKVIEEHRKALGLTQIQFAAEVGIEQSNVSRIENGNQWMDIETLMAVAHRFGTPLHLLFEEAEKRTGDALGRDALRVARKWQNAPPHQRAALAVLLGILPDSPGRTGTDG